MLFGKLCFSICVSCRLFAIFVSSMFGSWVFVVAWIFGVGVVCFCVLFFLLEGVMFPVFGSSFPVYFCLFLGAFFSLSQ